MNHYSSQNHGRMRSPLTNLGVIFRGHFPLTEPVEEKMLILSSTRLISTIFPSKIPLLWLFLNAIPWPRWIFCPRCSKVSTHGSREILSSKACRLASDATANSLHRENAGGPLGLHLIRCLGLYPVLKGSLHHFLYEISLANFEKHHMPGIDNRSGCQLGFINGKNLLNIGATYIIL